MQKCSNMAMAFEFDELEGIVVLRVFFPNKRSCFLGNFDRSVGGIALNKGEPNKTTFL